MEITFGETRVESSKGGMSVVCALTIHIFGDAYEEIDVDLVEFYVGCKSAVFDALVSGIDSFLSVDNEPLIFLSQSLPGITAKNLFVNNPAFSSIKSADISLETIRHFVSKLESQLSHHIAPFRDDLLRQFEASGSKRAFELLKLIERSNVIKPGSGRLTQEEPSP